MKRGQTLGGSLSPFAYFLRNKRKAVPVLAVIVLAVFAVSLTAVLTGSMIESSRVVYVEPFRSFSLVIGAKGAIPPEHVETIQASTHGTLNIPVTVSPIRVYGIFGSDQRRVFGLQQQDMQDFMLRTGLYLKEGRLPEGEQQELALHEDILKGKGGLAIGGEVGREVDERALLPGRYRVVGVLGGDMPFGIASYEAMKNNTPLGPAAGSSAFVIFPRRGQEGDLEKELSAMPRNDVSVFTLGLQQDNFRREIRNIDTIIWILNLVTILVMALATGLLNVIFFFQRMGEFGILAAIGYTRTALIVRTFMEVLWITLIGWAAGLLLSWMAISLVSARIYEPKGIHLIGIDARVLSFTMPIPVLISLFSLGVVVWQLWRLDPVSIVERRD